MKKLYIYLFSIISAFTVCLFIGLYFKASYADFNEESNPLEKFTVGLMPEEMCKTQADNMKNTLADSNYIIAVKVVQGLNFLPSCTTQKVEVMKVFKGDNIQSGEMIDIVFSEEIFWDERTYSSGTAYINMGFTNELSAGETYLLFLDREIETYDSERLFIRSDDFLMMPAFPYDHDRIGWAENESEEPDIYECSYKSVSEYDYFLSSEQSVEMVRDLRNTLVNDYPV